MSGQENSVGKVGVAVVGLGYWGPNLIRNFSVHRSCDVLYGCDLRPELLDEFRRRYPHIEFIDSFQRVLDDPRVNAVAIATPPQTHFKLASMALQAGKHVLVEKPMATTAAECEQLHEMARARGLVLAVDHTFVFAGAVQKIRDLVAAGELGDVYYFDSERINLGLVQETANVVWDLAPHDLAIIYHIFPNAQPKTVHVTGSRHLGRNVEEVAHISIGLDNGVAAHIHVSWLSPLKIRKILVGGSKKMVHYNDLEPSEKVRVYDRGVAVNFDEVTPFKPAYRQGDTFIPKLDESEPLFLMVGDFLDSVRESRPPRAGAELGLKIVRTLEACDRSLAERRPVEL